MVTLENYYEKCGFQNDKHPLNTQLLTSDWQIMQIS